MNKEIYLVRGDGTESYSDFTERIKEMTALVRDEVNPPAMKLVLTSEAPPVLSIIPFKRKMIASISVWKTDRVPVGRLVSMKGFAGAFRVTEAIPVAYEKTWQDMEMTPGVCLLTLFIRRKGLDTDAFIDRWHNSHTPLSLKIHPLWNYSRNVVDEMICGNSTPYEGIVEEQMRTEKELLNPFRFFGSPLVIIPRMISVYRDTKSFLDYKTIETYLAREWVIRS
jgi:hypothetical protein